MKLKYIVNANLNGKFARSVQINSNSSEFSKQLGDDFQCVAVGEPGQDYKHIWVNNIEKESSKLRKLFFHVQVIPSILSTDFVYSRNLSVLWLSNLLNRKIVWEIHDGLAGANLKIFNRIKSKLQIVAISDALKRYLIEEHQVAPEQILVAHDGVFIEKYDQLRKRDKSELKQELGLPTDRPIIMHSGSLFAGRGAELFETIVRNFPQATLVQVGGKPDDIEYWKSYYSFADNIVFTGHLNNDELVKHQMAADLMFLPMTKKSSIWWCTSPMKLFEYLATGNPICASDLGSIKEILNQGNSISFDPESPDSIIDSVNYFIANREICEQYGKKCLTLVKSEYTWDKRVERIVKFLST